VSQRYASSWIEENEADYAQDLIRISVGTEHIDDIIYDFEQSFKASSATTSTGKSHAQNAEETGGAEGEAQLVV
jgi:O-acetylhomoserine/O-acetylserine sulfhydrylase